jgi:hypothetical protein
MGLVALGYMWCRIVEAAMAGLARDASTECMYDRLVTTASWSNGCGPRRRCISRIRPGAGNVMELPAEAF